MHFFCICFLHVKGIVMSFVIEPKTMPSKPVVQPLLISTKEVAELLNVSEKTVYNLTRSGKLKCRKIERRTLYLREDIYKFIEECAVEIPAE